MHPFHPCRSAGNVSSESLEGLMGVILVCSRLSSHGGKLEVNRNLFFSSFMQGCQKLTGLSLSELLPFPPTAALLCSALVSLDLFFLLLS